MQFLYLFPTALLLTLTAAQNAAVGGGAPASALPAQIQYPIVINGPSLVTQPGGGAAAATTTTVQVVFTQTFVTPLATWAFGPTPSVGSVGLGGIKGTVGSVRGGG